jgi:hypothetical protein
MVWEEIGTGRVVRAMQTEAARGSPRLVFPNVQPQSLVFRKSVRMILESDLADYHTDPGRLNYKNGIPVEWGSEIWPKKKIEFPP